MTDMASLASLLEPARWSPRARTAGAMAVAAAAFTLGVMLAALGAMAGAAAVIALPVVLLVGPAVVSRPWVAVAIVYLALPASFLTVPAGGLDIKAIEVVAVAVTALTVLRRLGAGLSPLPWAPQLWWALLFVGWCLLATPSSVDLPSTLKQDTILVIGALLAATVLASCRDMLDVRRVLGVLMAVAAPVSALGLSSVSKLRAHFGGGVVSNRAQGIFDQPNDLGAFAAIMLMVSIGMTLGARTRWTRLLSGMTALLTLAALIASLSRGGWIGTAIASLALMVALPQARRAFLAIGLPLLLFGALGFTVLLRDAPPQVEVIKERIGTAAHPFNNPYDDRKSIWAEARREIALDPLTGQGPGSFPVASARAGSLARLVGAGHAHDTPLTVAAEVGIPALLLLLGFTVSVGVVVRRAVVRLPRERDRAVIAGVGAGMLAQVGQGLVDFNLRNPLLFLLMWSLVGLVLVAGRELGHFDRLRAQVAMPDDEAWAR